MIGTRPYDPLWRKEELARAISSNEAFSRASVTAIAIQGTPRKTLVTYVRNPLGSPDQKDVVIVDAGTPAPPGAKLITRGPAYVQNDETRVDIYRLP